MDKFKILINDLDMKWCAICPIVDYCNDYEETPPCAQKRFERVSCDSFIKLAEKSTATSKAGMYDEIEEQLKM